MQLRTYLLIWLMSLFTISAVAEIFPAPGYFDSYYYYHVAANLASGRGLVEDFIWNYLGNPSGVPQPANLYWMPLTSFIAAPFLLASGASFQAAQLPFILLSSLLPPLTAALAWRLLRDVRVAILSAFLTLFAGFYLSFWPAVDSFAPLALATTAALVLMDRMFHTPAQHGPLVQASLPVMNPSRNGIHHDTRPALLPSILARVRLGAQAVARAGRAPSENALVAADFPGQRATSVFAAAGCGAAIAIAHLARPDAILLLAVVAILALTRRPRVESLALALVVLLSYLSLMSPWFLRSLDLTGSPLAVAGAKTAWLRSYDELFNYLNQPSFATFLDWGIGNILWSRVVALAQNLTVFFGGAFHLAPFVALGLWLFRQTPEFRPFFVFAAVLYLVDSLVFAFPGPRGTMLHSGVALLPWMAIAAIAGLDRAITWVGARLRHWDVPRAQRNFGMLVLTGCAALGLFFAVRNEDMWGREYGKYILIAAWARDHTPPDALLMVTDPPAYAYVTGRPSIVTPGDGADDVLAAADRFGATFLALEADHTHHLDAIYDGSETNLRLKHLDDLGTTRMFAVVPSQNAEPARP